MDKWFNKAIIYQVYPKSFNDTNNDGVGDIKGIIDKIGYLKSLGINTVWLNPIYISPQIDNGYDVSNYFAVDSSLGTMKDVETLIATLHNNGMKLIMDFVMNHTSDQHPWFKDAIQNPDSIYRNYYLWAKGKKDKKPNNWGSFFGGSVWEKVPQSDDYYFHLFDKHMPDLNWKNPEVQKAVTDIAKFWVKKGIDGLRLDAFIHIDKANFSQDYPANGNEKFPLAESFYANRYGVQKYLRYFVSELKKLNQNLFIVGEASSANVNLAVDYSLKSNQLCDSVITFRNFADDHSNSNKHLPDNFQPASLDVGKFRQKFAVWESNLEGISYPTLYWSNHDMARVATRYADPNRLEISLKTLATAMYLQKGLPIIYYGEEIGMQNLQFSDFSDFDDQTVKSFRENAIKQNYDKKQILDMLNATHKMSARGAMQWNDSKYHGFSNHIPWKNGKTTKTNVKTQLNETTSILNFYKKLFRVKQSDLFITGVETILNTNNQVFAYQRETSNESALVICNLSSSQEAFNFDESAVGWKEIFNINNVNISSNRINLPAWGSIVLRKVDE